MCNRIPGLSVSSVPVPCERRWCIVSCGEDRKRLSNLVARAQLFFGAGVRRRTSFTLPLARQPVYNIRWQLSYPRSGHGDVRQMMCFILNKKRFIVRMLIMSDLVRVWGNTRFSRLLGWGRFIVYKCIPGTCICTVRDSWYSQSIRNAALCTGIFFECTCLHFHSAIFLRRTSRTFPFAQ